MRSTELKVNEENLIKTLRDDIFDRNEDIKAFIGILNNIEGNYSIALDGAWGSGKSFFVNHVKMVLDTQNDLVENSISDEDAKFIKNKFKFEENNHTHLTIYYDAWANDNDTDPIISLVYEIIRQMSKINSQDFDLYKFDVKGLLEGVIKSFASDKISGFLNLLKKENFLDEIQKEKDIQIMINEFFKAINMEIADRTVIFIDELDRCKPTYAIKLLERIKHYFVNENITFVFSINKKELQHTLKNCYGEGFNAIKYLEKFFDWPIELPAVDLEKCYIDLGIDKTNNNKEKMCRLLIKLFNFQLREMYKFIAEVNNKINTRDKFNQGEWIDIFLNEIMSLFLIGLKVYDKNTYDDFIDGKDLSILLQMINDKYSENSMFIKFILNDTESFNKRNDIDLDKRITEMYNYIFNFEEYIEKGQYEKIIGKISINKNTKTELLNIINPIK